MTKDWHGFREKNEIIRVSVGIPKVHSPAGIPKFEL
jgi:hypothetical protein